MVLRRLARLALLLWCVCGMATAQVVDCHRANLSHSDNAVCTSPSLHALDISVSRRYALVADDSRVKQSQHAWLQSRDRCNGNTRCLASTYRERNAYLATIAIPPPVNTGALGTSLQQLFLEQAPTQLLMPLPTSSTAMTPVGSASDRLNRAAGPLPVATKPPGWKPLWFLGGMLLAEILLWKMLTNVCGKCPHCHHWFARVELDRVTQTDDSVVPPLLRRRRFRHGLLAAGGASHDFPRRHSTSVRRHNQCSMCLHEWETTSREHR